MEAYYLTIIFCLLAALISGFMFTGISSRDIKVVATDNTLEKSGGFFAGFFVLIILVGVGLFAYHTVQPFIQEILGEENIEQNEEQNANHEKSPKSNFESPKNQVEERSYNASIQTKKPKKKKTKKVNVGKTVNVVVQGQYYWELRHYNNFQEAQSIYEEISVSGGVAVHFMIYESKFKKTYQIVFGTFKSKDAANEFGLDNELPGHAIHQLKQENIVFSK